MDNINNTCAPRMADGRLFSDYRSGNIRDNIVASGFTNANDHRHFLQNNADEIMNAHNHQVLNKECSSCELRPSAPSQKDVEDDKEHKKLPASLETDGKKENFSTNFSQDYNILSGVITGTVIYFLYALYLRK